MLDHKFLYYGYNDTITSFNKFTGEVIWQISLDTNEVVNYTGMAALTDSFLVAKTVVDGSQVNHYRIINKTDGTIISSYTHGVFSYSAPTVINNNLVECGYNKITFLDIMTGDSIYEVKGLAFGSCPNQIIGAKDKIIIVGQYGQIFILQSGPTSTHDITSNFDVAIFPNPARSNINVHLNLSTASTMELTLVSINGEIVSHKNIGYQQAGEYKFEVSVESLSSGLYFAQIKGDRGIVTKKIVVE
jgi:hypothetical protein